MTSQSAFDAGPDCSPAQHHPRSAPVHPWSQFQSATSSPGGIIAALPAFPRALWRRHRLRDRLDPLVRKPLLLSPGSPNGRQAGRTKRDRVATVLDRVFVAGLSPINLGMMIGSPVPFFILAISHPFEDDRSSPQAFRHYRPDFHRPHRQGYPADECRAISAHRLVDAARQSYAGRLAIHATAVKRRTIEFLGHTFGEGILQRSRDVDAILKQFARHTDHAHQALRFEEHAAEGRIRRGNFRSFPLAMRT